jgi:hypothetical protein
MQFSLRDSRLLYLHDCERIAEVRDEACPRCGARDAVYDDTVHMFVCPKGAHTWVPTLRWRWTIGTREQA